MRPRGIGRLEQLLEARAAPARAPRRGARATVRRARGRGCRPSSTSSRFPPSALPRSSKNGRAAASASRSGPWRSSSTSPSRTRRSTSASASSSAARISGRRSRSDRETLPRCRSETISVRMTDRRIAPPRRMSGRRRRLRPGAGLRTPRPRPPGGPRPASRICLGSMKRTSSRITSNSEMSLTPRARKNVDELLDEVLGRAGAGGDADDALALQPLLAHLAGVVDQMRFGAALAGDLDEALRVRRVAASRSRASGRSRRPSA